MILILGADPGTCGLRSGSRPSSPASQSPRHWPLCRPAGGCVTGCAARPRIFCPRIIARWIRIPLRHQCTRSARPWFNVVVAFSGGETRWLRYDACSHATKDSRGVGGCSCSALLWRSPGTFAHAITGKPPANDDGKVTSGFSCSLSLAMRRLPQANLLSS